VHGGDSGKGVPKIRAGVIALPTTTNSTQAAGRHLAVGLCSLAIGYWLLAIGYWLLAYFIKLCYWRTSCSIPWSCSPLCAGKTECLAFFPTDEENARRRVADPLCWTPKVG
jgi:hypothetical protein